jgi:hypothetical protein
MDRETGTFRKRFSSLQDVSFLSFSFQSPSWRLCLLHMQRSVQVFFFENLFLFHSPRIRLSCTLQPTLDTLKPWDTSRHLTFSPPSAVPNSGSKGGAGAHTLESAKFAKVGGRHRDLPVSLTTNLSTWLGACSCVGNAALCQGKSPQRASTWLSPKPRLLEVTFGGTSDSTS